MAPQGNFRHTETHSAVSREELMMVLAGLQQLQIRALFAKVSSAVSLRRVALEVAGEEGRGPPASTVELCLCPANYLGASCQVRRGGAGRPRGTATLPGACACLPYPLAPPHFTFHLPGATLPAARPPHLGPSQAPAQLSAPLLSPCVLAPDPLAPDGPPACARGSWSAPRLSWPASAPDPDAHPAPRNAPPATSGTSKGSFWAAVSPVSATATQTSASLAWAPAW